MRARARLQQLLQTLRPSPSTTSRQSKSNQPFTTTSQTSSATHIKAMSTKSDKETNTITDDGVEVSLPPDLDASTLKSFPAYQNWRKALSQSLSAQSHPSHPFNSNPYSLKSITIQSSDFFNTHQLGFLKLKAHVTNSNSETIPGAVFMRGGSVAMLIILQPSPNNTHDEPDEFVLLTSQPRIPAGSLSFTELPAGMIDDSGTFSGAAAREIHEETGLDIRESELVDMTKLAIEARSDNNGEEPHLQCAVYPSPGGCDEFIPIFLVRKTMEAGEIEELKGKLTGLREEGEKITLRICRLRDLWKVGARDGKTLAAVALYEGLRREGRI